MRQDIFTAIKTRGHMAGGRIGSASRYLRRMANAIGEARLAEHLATSPADLKAAIARVKSQLTWFDEDHATPAAIFSNDPKGKDGATVKTTGVPLIKNDGDYKLAGGSIMDFDCVITTGRRDRDGDVLEPKGALVDQKMALLWQHVPYQPIGRMVRLLDQDEKRVSARFMIADTQLGHDAAVLIESGCLRISHGFSPIEYQPLKDDQGKDLGGWHIHKYAMMETSVVSIPSNIDGEIEAASRGKLHHPLTKAWAKMLNDARPKMFPVRSGKSSTGTRLDAIPQEVKITLDIKGLPQAAAAVVPKKGKGKKADDDEEDDDDEDKDDDTPAETPKDDAEPADADEDEDADDEDKDDEETEAKDDDDDAGEGKGGKVLGELIDSIREMGQRNDLPKEAAGRLGVVNGMLEDVEAAIGSSADTIATCAKSRDLAGMFSAMGELVDACVGQLRGVGEEIDRVAGIADLPDEVVAGLDEIRSGATAIVDGVTAMTAAGNDAVEDADETREDDELDERDDDLEDDKDDDDEEDSVLEEDERDADEDDRDDKDDDDEDREEKGDGVDSPDAEIDPTEDNPGVDPRSARPKKRADDATPKSEMDRLLGKFLTGEKLGAETERMLRRAYPDLTGTPAKKRSTKRRGR